MSNSLKKELYLFDSFLSEVLIACETQRNKVEGILHRLWKLTQQKGPNNSMSQELHDLIAAHVALILEPPAVYRRKSTERKARKQSY